MIPLGSTEMPPLEFSEQENSKKTIAVGNKIGWLQSIADTDGASFDIKVKDIHGQVKFERKNCKTDTKEYGELINEETLLGENLTVEIDNLQGAKSLKVFLN